MKQFKKVLAAIDFSKYSNQVIEHAVTLAHELRAEMLCVHIINQRDIDIIRLSFDVLKRVSKDLSIEGLTKKLHEEREAKMKNLLAQIDSTGLGSRFIIRTGSPVQELLKVVEEEKVDMVIVGAKGKNRLEDTIIGSTALKMFRQCPVALVTVR